MTLCNERDAWLYIYMYKEGVGEEITSCSDGNNIDQLKLVRQNANCKLET